MSITSCQVTVQGFYSASEAESAYQNGQISPGEYAAIANDFRNRGGTSTSGGSMWDVLKDPSYVGNSGLQNPQSSGYAVTGMRC